MKAKDLKSGSILSESSFFVVKSVDAQYVHVIDDDGRPLQIGHGYVETVLNSADVFETEVKKNMTELSELFINSARIAMTVAFIKKEQAKTQKEYKAEVAAAIAEVQSAPVSKVEALLTKLIENPISKVIPGDLRVMKGRHYGFVDNLGRIHFIDMELPKEIKQNKEGVDYDTRKREVDPRTIQYLIIAGVKYSLK